MNILEKRDLSQLLFNIKSKLRDNPYNNSKSAKLVG